MHMYICSLFTVHAVELLFTYSHIHLFKNWNKSVVKEYHLGLFCGETYGYGICGRLGFRIQLIVPTQFERKMYTASCKKCSWISSRAVNGRRLSAFVQISGLFQIYITYISTIFKMSIWSKEKGWQDCSFTGRLRNLTY